MRAELLKKEILKKYPSVRAFAKAINIPSTTIQSAIDDDKIGRMAVETVVKMCDALGIDVKTFKSVAEQSCWFTDEEMKIIQAYRSGSERTKGKIEGILLSSDEDENSEKGAG